MKRPILAVFAGLVTWIVVATLLDLVVRRAISGYAAAEPSLTFTLPMMIARLALGAASSVAAGAVAARIARRPTWVPWVLSAVMLGYFLPVHAHLWHALPAWYHLTFLVTLAPLVVLGAMLTRRLGLENVPSTT